MGQLSLVRGDLRIPEKLKMAQRPPTIQHEAGIQEPFDVALY